jgi:uncharacterized protein YbcV (DUF1398 family)
MNVIEHIDSARALALRIRPAVGGFPYLAEVLRRASVQRYVFDVPSASVVYSTADGDVLYPGALIRHEPTIIPPFDEQALISALRRDQEGHSTFPEFVEASLLAGVVRYEVDTAARTCSYFGIRGETYVEQYAAVDLEAIN